MKLHLVHLAGVSLLVMFAHAIWQLKKQLVNYLAPVVFANVNYHVQCFKFTKTKVAKKDLSIVDFHELVAHGEVPTTN